jgi:hypothetical protein
VHLGEADVELAHGADDEGGEQRGAIGAVQAVQGASEAVVAEEAGLPRLEADVLRDATGSPLGESVKRAAYEEEVGSEGAEDDRSGDVFGAPARRRQVSREERFEL